jgi:hypothetical protein
MYEAVVLGFGLALFFLTWYKPLPYGRFSDQMDLPLKIIPNRWFIAIVNIPALVCLCFQTEGLSNFGTVVLAFLFAHFGLRTVVVPIVTGFIYTSDTKMVSVLCAVPLMVYNGFVGVTLASAATELSGDFGSLWTDWPLLVGAGTCLLMNVYYDIYINYLRCHSDEIEIEMMYITEESLCKEFELLFALGITSPNYFFEIIEWGLIVLLTWRTQTIAYFISTGLLLWTRALHISIFNK